MVTDPSSYRPAPGQIPTSPGVYRFRDPEGRVIYVGKAKSLRARLNSYFQDPDRLHSRTRTMVTSAASVDWTVVANEVEALALEYTWIKEFDPRFNVMYRDDKSYPSLAITVSEKFPRVLVMRGERKSGVKYFGPYGHAWAIRDTVDTLLRVYPMRSCSAGVFRRAELSGRPCLLGDIGKCAAPCVGRVNEQEHRAIVNDFISFMAGNTKEVVDTLKTAMADAAANQEYELAAKFRDDLVALDRALEKQTIVLAEDVDADVFGFVEDPLEVAVQIFNVRGGRVRGQRGWVAEREEDLDMPELVQRALMTLYADPTSEPPPREILVPQLPADHSVVTALLREHRGGPVEIRVPRRGDKRRLHETVTRNAMQVMARHKVARAGDLTSRSRALEELQEALFLPQAPLRIECYDVSHTQGQEPVGSMVVFEDGLPKKGHYRRFKISEVSNDDTAAIAEMIRRRFKRLKSGDDEATSDEDQPENEGFAYRPGLVVIDGGAPQVNAAAGALSELGIVDIPVCGLAKRLEEVWLPADPDPVVLPRSSEALYLLQRVRDEAHRFAISHHRRRRTRASTASVLDGVPGVGPHRRKALLRHFGSVKALRAASVEQVSQVPGVGPSTAAAIVAALGETPPTQTLNTATGEILEEQP